MEKKDDKDDPMVRDRKSLPMSDVGTALKNFLITVLLVLPIWLMVLLPLSIIWQTVSWISNYVASKRSKEQKQPSPKVFIEKIEKASSAVKDRIYDVVVFGATGFTGRLACLYLAKQYGKEVRWAIAGRRRDALERIRDELTSINCTLKDLPIIIADCFDEPALNNLTQSTKVVITTAGPFSKYGTALVKSCVLHGTHYCDTTGETDWVREMVDQFDTAARVSGAQIVHFCGNDCIPWDLSGKKFLVTNMVFIFAHSFFPFFLVIASFKNVDPSERKRRYFILCSFL
jgi:hypothetical protein